MASEAQIRANQANSLKSTGPVTDEGKRASAANSLKHGLTGAGVVLPPSLAAQAERLEREYQDDLRPNTRLGRDLIGRLALQSVRMEQCVALQSAAQDERIAGALAGFDADWPAEEGVSDPERAKERSLVVDRARFDASKEATLVCKYEAACERSFFRALKELPLVERQAKVARGYRVEGPAGPGLGSFSPRGGEPKRIDEPKRGTASPAPKPPEKLAFYPETPLPGRVDVPFTIGKPR